MYILDVCYGQRSDKITYIEINKQPETVRKNTVRKKEKYGEGKAGKLG